MIKYSFKCMVCDKERTSQTENYTETVPTEICCGAGMLRIYKVTPVIFAGDGWTDAMNTTRGK